jgi:hypothetical protein
MPLYRKIPYEMTLQKAENFVETSSYSISAAGATKSSVFPDDWHYFDTDAEAQTGLSWPIFVPRREDDAVRFREYVNSQWFQEYLKAFSALHGYPPSIVEEAASDDN